MFSWVKLCPFVSVPAGVDPITNVEAEKGRRVGSRGFLAAVRVWPASGGARGHPCGQGDSLGLGIRGRQSLPWMPVPVPRPGSAPRPGRDPSSVCVSSGHHRARLPTEHTRLPLGWAVSSTPTGLLLLWPCHSFLIGV